LSFKNRFPYISVIDEASDFKFGKKLRFVKAHHEIPLEEKVGLGLELSEIWGFPLPRPIIKSHPEEEVGMAFG